MHWHQLRPWRYVSEQSRAPVFKELMIQQEKEDMNPDHFLLVQQCHSRGKGLAAGDQGREVRSRQEEQHVAMCRNGNSTLCIREPQTVQ